MAIITISNTGVLSVAFNVSIPLPDELYILQSPDTTKWTVLASGATGILTVTDGAIGTALTSVTFVSPNGTEWVMTVDNAGVLTLTPFASSLLFSPIGNKQYKAADGSLMSGYLLFFFTTHTTTNEITYKNRTYDQPVSNPIVLNSLGFPTDPIFIEYGKSYTVVLAPPGSPNPPVAPVYTWDDVNAGPVQVSSSSEWLSPAFSATGLTGTSFIVVGDQRSSFAVGGRLKLTDATTKYGTISGRTYDGVITTVTVLMDSGNITSSLTSVAISINKVGQPTIPDRYNNGLRTFLAGDLVINVTKSFNLFPVGIMMNWNSNILPAGFLWCDGTAYSRTTYSRLFTAIGTAFGAGNGTTTFNVPDRRGRASIGKDDMGGVGAAGIVTSASQGGANAIVLGGVGGGETTVLTISTLATHNHPLTPTDLWHNSGGANNPSGAGVSGVIAGTVGNTGGGGAHNNMNPWEAKNVIIYAGV